MRLGAEVDVRSDSLTASPSVFVTYMFLPSPSVFILTCTILTQSGNTV